MKANELIEQGKARIEARKLQGQLEHEARERERQAMLDAEMRKFVAEAIEPLRAACPDIHVGEIGEINEYTWKVNVPLGVRLCTTVQAEFELPGSGNIPRQERTWKFTRFLVPQVALNKGPDECTEPWTARQVFWSRGYLDATEVENLDEALALASERFAKWAPLEQEADARNRAIKAEQAQREEKEATRIEAEQAAFHPFAYYRVTYGIVADEDGEKYADMGHFDSLRDIPFADGYWLTVSGMEMRVEHLVSVERRRVKSLDEMPHWCPKVETDWGWIRVSPVVPSVR